MGNVIELIAKYGGKIEPLGRASLALVKLVIRLLEPRAKADGALETPDEVEARIVALVASADASLGRVEDRAKAEIDKLAGAGGGAGV